MGSLRLFTWLAVVSLTVGLLIGNILAPITSTYAEARPIKMRVLTEKPTVGDEIQLEVTIAAPIGKDYAVKLPEHLTFDEDQFRKGYRDDLKDIQFDQQTRQLKFDFKDLINSQRLQLSVKTDQVQTFELQASGQIPVPATDQKQAEAVEQQTSTNAAVDLPTEYHEYQSEPLKLDVANKKDVQATDEKAEAEDSTVNKEATGESKRSDSSQTEDEKSSSTTSQKSSTDSQKAETSTAEESVKDKQEDQSNKRITKVEPKKRAKSLALASVTSVTNYDEFKAAYTDSDVTEITLGTDVIAPNNPVANDLPIRTTGVTINGNNKSLDIGRAAFRVGATTGNQTIRVQNFKSIRAAATTTTASQGAYGIVQNGGDATGTVGSKWIAHFEDITTHPDVQRLASVAGNQVEIAGTVNSNTVWEAAVTSGVKVADNAVFTARKSRSSGQDRSFFWFPASTISGGLGDKRFVIGDGAKVDCQGASYDVTYPVVYLNYEELIVGTGATYIAKMYGFVYNAQQSTNVFTAKENSKVTMENMRENGGQTAINFAVGSSNFTVKAGSEFYATNRSRAPVFGGIVTNVHILIDSPKKYDIQNTSTGLTAASASIVPVTIASFRITNTNLSMWSVTLPVSVNAKATYQNVAWIEQNLTFVESSHNGLLASLFSFSISRRINNTLSIPTAEFTSPYAEDLGKALVTNADKKVRLRVIMGYEESGETAVPIYAGAKDATVELMDDEGIKHTAQTDANGYVNFTFSRFLTAGKELKATVTTSFTADPVMITVQDKTPPTPITVKNGRILADQTQISGENAGVGQVRYTVNNVGAVNGAGTEITDTVSGSGTWQMTRATPKWKANDQVQLFIKDAAGNENPTAETKYHDATFAAATKYTVAPASGPTPPTQPDNPGSGPASETENSGTGNTGELRLDYAPSNFNFGEVVTSWRDKTYSAKEISGVSKQWLQVSDNRLNQHGWSVKVRQSQAFKTSTGTMLDGATVNLPVGQTYNENKTDGLKSHSVSVTAADQTVFGANGTSNVGKDLSTNVWQPAAVSTGGPGGAAVNGKTYNGTVSWTLTTDVDS